MVLGMQTDWIKDRTSVELDLDSTEKRDKSKFKFTWKLCIVSEYTINFKNKKEKKRFGF